MHLCIQPFDLYRFPDSVASPPSMNRFILPRFGFQTKPRLSNCALRSCASGPYLREEQNDGTRIAGGKKEETKTSG